MQWADAAPARCEDQRFRRASRLPFWGTFGATRAQVDKATFLARLRSSYSAVMPRESPCAGGPRHAVVAREIGRRRPRRPHLHLAGEFRDAQGNRARHRWRQARDHLARVHGIQVRLGVRLGLLSSCPLRAWAAGSPEPGRRRRLAACVPNPSSAPWFSPMVHSLDKGVSHGSASLLVPWKYADIK